MGSSPDDKPEGTINRLPTIFKGNRRKAPRSERSGKGNHFKANGIPISQTPCPVLSAAVANQAIGIVTAPQAPTE